MFSLKLAFRNILARKSSLVIILFISFSIAMMVLANSIFDGTGTGIKSSFISSFTGDIVIRPKTDFPLSLFGDETPATGSFTEIPRIPEYESVQKFIGTMPEIDKSVPQISHAVMLTFGEDHSNAVLFGVDIDRYLSEMTGIRIVEKIDDFAGYRENCIIMSRNFIEFVENDSHTKINLGDMIQIVTKTPMSYNIRSAKLCAIYEYAAENPVLDRISLVNSELLLDMLGKADADEEEEEIDSSYQNLLDDDLDLDSLFDDFSLESDETAPLQLNDAGESAPNSVGTADVAPSDADEYWHFLICRVRPGEEGKTRLLMLQMNKFFKQNGIAAEAINWRTAAGLSAQYLYWIRLIFNIGIFIILATGFIVVNSALTISSIDRIRETGTMRAIGASRSFIGTQYLFETMILTVSSGVFGCILGAIFVAVLNAVPLTFTNPYLMQLFGGTRLTTSISAGNIRSCFVLVALLTVWGWIHPVRVALGTSPMKAMQGGA